MSYRLQDVVIVGAGNLGLLLHDCLVGDLNWRCVGFIDDGKAGETIIGLPVFSTYDYDPTFCASVFLAVGFPDNRRRMVEKLAHLQLDWASFVDRRSMVGPGAKLGRGVLVLSFAALASGVTVRDFVYISCYANAGTRSVIGEYSALLAGSSIGASTVGGDCLIGLKSTCLDVAIGDGATIAPHSLVRSSVPAGAFVAGVPARIGPQRHRSTTVG